MIFILGFLSYNCEHVLKVLTKTRICVTSQLFTVAVTADISQLCVKKNHIVSIEIIFHNYKIKQ